MYNFRNVQIALMGILVAAGVGGCQNGMAVEEPEGQAVTGNLDLDGPVTIRFLNGSNSEAVEVLFFATDAPLENLPDDLFVEQNQVQRSIGPAGQGFLEPRAGDEIEWPCSPDLTIGTMGGRFLESESGDERGFGQARWLRQGPLALCGSTITFVYTRDGDAFSTLVKVDN